MHRFDFQRLDVYRIGVRCARAAESVVMQLPPGRAYLVDQMRRASLSVVHNIAEGAGEIAPREKRRFYRMARRSATECAAALDVCVVLDLVPKEVTEETRRLLIRVVSMLSKLARERV